MTPQLQQAIKLLQLSNLELADYIEAELEQNPLLERVEGGEEALDQTPSVTESPAAPDGQDEPAENAATRDSLDFASSEDLPSGDDAPLDSEPDFDDNSPSDDWGLMGPAAGASRTSGSFDAEDMGLEQRLSETVSLRDHLSDQLHLDVEDPVDRVIGAYFLDSLNESGYVTADPEEVAVTLGCEVERTAGVLAKLQAFDPSGICARDLRECLQLQLADRDRLDPCMATLLDNLDLVARRDHARLKKLCQVDDEDFNEMLAELRALDPKPALRFGGQPAEPVIPDIIMRQQPGGGWFIELNSESLPRVLVNASYYSRIAGQCRRKADREYVTEQFNAANWLVKSLHQRATTILKVATEIVRLQDGFFRHGVSHLRPLTLRNVAEVIEMHESTVSRVTSNKFMSTPRGTFELKYFFTASIAGVAGGEHSAEAVRYLIRTLIDGEQPAAVLSDDTLVDMLRAEGIDIARRTVAKYRESMRIPSSVQRRREKALAP
jgi:RNA polymerase sigma-54 factor